MDDIHVTRTLRAVIPLLPVPMTFDQLAINFGTARARPLRIREWPLSHGPLTALWVKDRDEDFIYYDAGADPSHQRQGVFHELGHIAQGHPPTTLQAARSSPGCPYPAALQATAEQFATTLVAIVASGPDGPDELSRAGAVLS